MMLVVTHGDTCFWGRSLELYLPALSLGSNLKLIKKLANKSCFLFPLLPLYSPVNTTLPLLSPLFVVFSILSLAHVPGWYF